MPRRGMSAKLARRRRYRKSDFLKGQNYEIKEEITHLKVARSLEPTMVTTETKMKTLMRTVTIIGISRISMFV